MDNSICFLKRFVFAGCSCCWDLMWMQEGVNLFCIFRRFSVTPGWFQEPSSIRQWMPEGFAPSTPPWRGHLHSRQGPDAPAPRRTGRRNFWHLKWSFVRLLWVLMWSQPQGHLSKLVLWLLTTVWCWRTSSQQSPRFKSAAFSDSASVTFLPLPLVADVCETVPPAVAVGSRNSLFLDAMLSHCDTTCCWNDMLELDYPVWQCLSSPCFLLPHVFFATFRLSLGHCNVKRRMWRSLVVLSFLKKGIFMIVI